MEMGQKLVAKLFEFDEQTMRGWHMAHDADTAAMLVREFGALVEHMDAIDLGAGNEEKLLVGIGC